MYKISANAKYNFEIKLEDNNLDTGVEQGHSSLVRLSESKWHMIKNKRSFNVEIVNLDRSLKTAEIKVNNNTYSLTAKDQYDMLLDQLGLSALTATKISEIKAPMPGLVLKVFVAEGMEVKKGDNLFVLEAMKMENIIKSPADITVKAVKIKAGDKVEKGQILLSS